MIRLKSPLPLRIWPSGYGANGDSGDPLEWNQMNASTYILEQMS
jgi:hypothetical protein